jgi:hypothetical protein
MKVPRSNSYAFLVNDAIYVFGGCSPELSHGLIGERYALSENKWKEVKPKNINEGGSSNLISNSSTVYGPASLLYE